MDSENSPRDHHREFDESMGSSYGDYRFQKSRALSFYQNYTEIFCASASTSKAGKSIQSKELIQVKPENSDINQNASKWAKVFELDARTLLTVTIQGKIIELTIKDLCHNFGTSQLSLSTHS